MYVKKSKRASSASFRSNARRISGENLTVRRMTVAGSKHKRDVTGDAGRACSVLRVVVGLDGGKGVGKGNLCGLIRAKVRAPARSAGMQS